MMLARLGSRDRRIDRAHDNMMRAIDLEEAEALRSCETWLELDQLSIRMNERRLGVSVRADNLCARWHARVMAMENDE